MSRISRFLFEHLDIGDAANLRRLSYRELAGMLSTLRGVRVLHSSLLPGACPLLLPVIFENFPHAHLALRAHGIPAVTWGGVKPACLAMDEFPDSAFLYDNLVLLPIHQGLNRNDLHEIARAVATVRNEGRAAVHIPQSFEMAASGTDS